MITKEERARKRKKKREKKKQSLSSLQLVFVFSSLSRSPFFLFVLCGRSFLLFLLQNARVRNESFLLFCVFFISCLGPET